MVYNLRFPWPKSYGISYCFRISFQKYNACSYLIYLSATPCIPGINFHRDLSSAFLFQMLASQFLQDQIFAQIIHSPNFKISCIIYHYLHPLFDTDEIKAVVSIVAPNIFLCVKNNIIKIRHDAVTMSGKFTMKMFVSMIQKFHKYWPKSIRHDVSSNNLLQ